LDASIVLSVQEVAVDAAIVPIVLVFVKSVIAPCAVVVVKGAVIAPCARGIVIDVVIAPCAVVIAEFLDLVVAPIVQNASRIATVAKMIIHAKLTVLRHESDRI